MNKIARYIKFFRSDIWKSSSQERPFFQNLFLTQLKILLLAVRKFDQKHGRAQAASLTYYSVLSLVPAVTLLYGLLRGFGLDRFLETQLYQTFSGHDSAIHTLLELAQSYVEATSQSVFAGIGVTLLMWGLFNSLRTIEDAFNNIWGVRSGKPLSRKLSDYLAVFLIGPLFLIVSGSITVLIPNQLNYISENFIHLEALMPLVYLLLHILPLVVIWILFTFIYIFMPNTSVQFKAGLFGGIVAGSMYQIWQWIYIHFQVEISRMSAIYGSLAAIPLFLMWLQISWMIVLFGAEASFAQQNYKTYEFEPDNIRISAYYKKLSALLIAYMCVKKFEKGEHPWTAQQFSDYLDIPMRLVQEVIMDLCELGLLSKVIDEGSKEFFYQPGRSIDDITLDQVIEGLEHLGEEEIPFKKSPEFKKTAEHLEKLHNKIKNSTDNILLKDL